MSAIARWLVVLLSFVWLFADGHPSLPVGFAVAVALLLRKPMYYESTYTRWDTVRAEKLPLALCVVGMIVGYFFVHIGPALAGERGGLGFGCLFDVR